METVLVNLIEPGDRVLIGVNGVFGGRMVDIAQRCGAQFHTVEAPWGQIIEQGRMIEAVRTQKPKLAAIVHAETSHGNPSAGGPTRSGKASMRATAYSCSIA